MVSRTWIGGSNNKADNPKDWSPTGAPQPGDDFTMSSGTMNVTDDDLKSDELIVTGSASLTLQNANVVGSDNTRPGINFRPSAQASLALKGTNTATIENFGNTVVNVAANSTWTGGFEAHSGTLTINGASHAIFTNIGTPLFPENSTVSSGDAIINATVDGTGNFAVFGGKLSFSASVGSGQKVDVNGINGSNSGPFVQLNDPINFHGLIDVSFTLASPDEPQSDDLVNLIGLATADSYTFKNDLLSIFGGGKVIDTLRLHDSTSNGFALVKTAGSLNIVAITDPANPPMGLPIHMG